MVSENLWSYIDPLICLFCLTDYISVCKMSQLSQLFLLMQRMLNQLASILLPSTTCGNMSFEDIAPIGEGALTDVIKPPYAASKVNNRLRLMFLLLVPALCHIPLLFAICPYTVQELLSLYKVTFLVSPVSLQP